VTNASPASGRARTVSDWLISDRGTKEKIWSEESRKNSFAAHRLASRAADQFDKLSCARVVLWVLDSSGVYICKSIVNDLRHGNYTCKSEVIYLDELQKQILNPHSQPFHTTESSAAVQKIGLSVDQIDRILFQVRVKL
jgi:hypothetical protein